MATMGGMLQQAWLWPWEAGMVDMLGGLAVLPIRGGEMSSMEIDLGFGVKDAVAVGRAKVRC